MDNTRTDELSPRKPLRLWPGVVIVIVQWLARFVLPIAVPGSSIVVGASVMGGVAGGLGVVVWWLFFSRAPRPERLGALAVVIVAMGATFLLLDESIATGAMGILFFILVAPFLSLAFVAWAVVSRHLSDGWRPATMVATIALACGAWTLGRTGGFTSNFDNDLAWRWADTPEERLLAIADEPTILPPVPAATATAEGTPPLEEGAEPPASPDEPVPVTALTETEPEWPGFRGPDRTSIIPGVRIETNWSEAPPVELWRRPIGPGWSSFSVDGGVFYTQEQRGEEEVVTAYTMATGEPVWRHRDTARFWESNGGAGPRATPTLSGGLVYTFGATGILNALDATDGTVVWSRNAAADTDTPVPFWGLSSSPLLVDDLVIIAVESMLAAYDLATGDLRWVGPRGGDGYSSPHLTTIDGVPQVLLMSGAGVISVAPNNGATLWEHPWPPGAPIVQPALTAEGDVLLSDSGIIGVRRIAVKQVPSGWSVEERWTSNRLKPYFNDFVVHEGHAYGFDGSILASMDLEDGSRKWKGGRYGQGQLLLLPDQDLLLVISERGELALVGATPDEFTELARFPAIEGKTWNHPVLVGDVLLVRNGEEMAAFRLTLENR